jgi:uncharacterized protein YcgI (DUF1989 family)
MSDTLSDTADSVRCPGPRPRPGGTRVKAMPTVPANAAIDLPPGVAAADLVWDETIAPGGYASRQIARGTRLRLTDLAGDAAVSLLLFNAERPIERLNIADTLKVQWNGYLGQGRLLLSDMGRVLASLVEDRPEPTTPSAARRTRPATRANTATASTTGSIPTLATASRWASPSSAWGARTSIPA